MQRPEFLCGGGEQAVGQTGLHKSLLLRPWLRKGYTMAGFTSGLRLNASTHTPASYCLYSWVFTHQACSGLLSHHVVKSWGFVVFLLARYLAGGDIWKWAALVLEEYPVHMGIPPLLVSKYHLVLYPYIYICYIFMHLYTSINLYTSLYIYIYIILLSSSKRCKGNVLFWCRYAHHLVCINYNSTLCVVSAQVRANNGKWWKLTAKVCPSACVRKGTQYDATCPRWPWACWKEVFETASKEDKQTLSTGSTLFKMWS